MKNKLAKVAGRVLEGGLIAASIIAGAFGGSAAPAQNEAPTTPEAMASTAFNAHAAPASSQQAATYTSNKGGAYVVKNVNEEFWVKWICVPSNRGGMVRCYKNRYPGPQPPDWNTNNYVPFRAHPENPFDRTVVTNGGTLVSFPGRPGPSWP